MAPSEPVTCPICSCQVYEENINRHIDSRCHDFLASRLTDAADTESSSLAKVKSQHSTNIAPIFSSKASGKHAVDPKEVPRTSGMAQSTVPSTSKRKKTMMDPSQTPNKRGKHVESYLASAAPLAEKLRPKTLAEFVGQEHLTGRDSLLMDVLQKGTVGSMIFWGPPGCGKTTLARLLAERSDAAFKELSATSSGINDVRAIFEEAKNVLALTRRKTILFLDEIHRFNKAQQDIFLPYVEQGYVELIGATTENPSFKLTGALLSRCRVFVLDRLTDDNIREIIVHAIGRLSSDDQLSDKESKQSEKEPGSSQTIPSQLSTQQPTQSSSTSSDIQSSFPQLTPRIISSIVSLSTGDARTAISLLELVIATRRDIAEEALLLSLRRAVSASYDRTGESHYDMISALHKSVRGSQGSAALYWLARMLTAGEDPLYIARRMVVCASEDIGLADNHALPLAMATFQACQVIGMPECRINLAHLVAYLSEAPKSTRAYEGYNRAEASAKQDLTTPVPMPMRNAPTPLMKELGYSQGYRYNPEFLHPVHNDYLPPHLKADVYLKSAGDVSEKIWDEEGLVRWENEVNGGKKWEGRRGRRG